MREWKPYKWFPWVEWREVGYCPSAPHLCQDQYETYWHLDEIPPCDGCCTRLERRWKRDTAIKVPEPIEPPQYNYLLDNGRLWTGPGDTAFWNAPSTCDELAAWVSRYHPTSYGVYDAGNNVRIEWCKPKPNPYGRQTSYLNPYLQSMLQGYYQNSPRNGLPGGWL